MKTFIFTERLRPVYLAATFTAVAALSSVANASSPIPVKLLTAKFEARQVVQVEAGETKVLVLQ